MYNVQCTYNQFICPFGNRKPCPLIIYACNLYYIKYNIEDHIDTLHPIHLIKVEEKTAGDNVE